MQRSLIKALNFFVVTWGGVFIIILAISNFALIVNNQSTIFGLPVFDVKDTMLVSMLAAPALIASFVLKLLKNKKKKSKKFSKT